MSKMTKADLERLLDECQNEILIRDEKYKTLMEDNLNLRERLRQSQERVNKLEDLYISIQGDHELLDSLSKHIKKPWWKKLW